jgi:membrane protein
LVRQILFELVESKIISPVNLNNGKDVAYQPATDVNKLTILYVVQSLEQRGISDIPVAEKTELNKISERLSKIAGDIKQSPENVLLKDI